MKTSGNVLGIQAKQTLKRIGETWKAVVRQGEASAHIQIIGDSRRGMAAIFKKQEHVLTEERVKREIPEPNWQDSRVPLLAGMIHSGTPHVYRTAQGRVQRAKRQLLYRVSAIGGSQQRAAGNALQTAHKPFQRQRYTRSSLSPPPEQKAVHVQHR